MLGCQTEPAAERGAHTAVAVTQQALVESIAPFAAAGDFEESGDLTGWSGNCDRSSSQRYAGSYSLRCGGGGTHTRTLDASGYSGITVSYWGRGSSLESGESFTVEWSTDGSNWTVLETASDESWNFRSHALPSSADGASALRLRFRTSASSSSTDAAYLDNLDFTGDNAGSGCAGSETSCDGLDEDCDGSTDEGLLNACGQCGSTPSEVCDGSDNDCDGSTDEGVTNACGGCGAVPSDDDCDSVDDDCDGSVDEAGSCGGGGGGTSGSIPPFAAAGDFEDSGDLTGWSGGCARSTSQSSSGSYALRCGGGQTHTLTLDASSYTGIAVDYARTGSSLESGESFTVEWSTDGSNWTVLETASDQSWSSRSYNLPTSANNASALRLRFRTSASSSSTDAAYLDDLDVTGTSGSGGGGGAYCGDGTCDAGEDCGSCSADCGSCGTYCGDGTCDAGEDCGSCSADCGSCGYPTPSRHYLIGDSVMHGYRSLFVMSDWSYGDRMHDYLTGALGISATKSDISENGAGWTVCNAGSCNHCDQQVMSISSTSGHALLNISCVGNDLLDFESASASTMQSGMTSGGQYGTSLVDDILGGITNALNHCNSTSAFPYGCTLIQAPTYDINDVCESASNVNWTSDAVALCTNSAYGGCPFSTTPVVGQPRCASGRPCRAMMLMDLNHMIGHVVETYQFSNPNSRAAFLDDHVDTFAGHARDYSSCDIGCGSSWRAGFDFNGDGETAACNTGVSYISSSDSLAIHPSDAGHEALAADGYDLLESLYGN